jgi:hypothetical protein
MRARMKKRKDDSFNIRGHDEKQNGRSLRVPAEAGRSNLLDCCLMTYRLPRPLRVLAMT